MTLIDKTRLKEVRRKSGETAKFLELVLIETPNGRFGDFIVKQSCTKEERAARKEMPILGNGKNFDSRGGGAPRRDSAPPASEQPPMDSDSVPF